MQTEYLSKTRVEEMFDTVAFWSYLIIFSVGPKINWNEKYRPRQSFEHVLRWLLKCSPVPTNYGQYLQ